MTKRLDEQTERTARVDARALEAESEATEPYPPGTQIVRPNLRSRMFNVRLTDEQFSDLQRLAREYHLPMSTMARSWLLERLDRERHATPHDDAHGRAGAVRRGPLTRRHTPP